MSAPAHSRSPATGHVVRRRMRAVGPGVLLVCLGLLLPEDPDVTPPARRP